MREIIFRAKTIEKGMWVEGFYSHNQSGNHYITRVSGTGCAMPYKVYPDTVGQYTGLIDENGKKIFEGDKIAGLFLYSDRIVGSVAFMEGAFGVSWMRGEAKMFTPFTSTCNVTWEVVEDE